MTETILQLIDSGAKVGHQLPLNIILKVSLDVSFNSSGRAHSESCMLS